VTFSVPFCRATGCHKGRSIFSSSKNQKSSTMTSETTNAAAAAATLPNDVPSCWLCLEEGPDEGGAPLVRDCSCRGTSGFAHLSCIVKYAEIEGKQLYEREWAPSCIRPFSICPNCKQFYQSGVRKGLAKACVEFVEKGFKDKMNFLLHKHLYAHAMMNQMAMLDGENEGEKAGGEELTAKFTAVLGDMKSQLEQLESLDLDRGGGVA